MALPLFVVSTADFEDVEASGTKFSHHMPHEIFQDRFCHISAIPTQKPETGSLGTRAQIFRNFFGNKRSKYY
jgi:hypothetical protein